MPTREELRRTLVLPRAPKVDLADLGIVAIVGGALGVCALLAVIVVWWAGLALFFCLLVLFGISAVRESRASAAITRVIQ